MFMVNVLRIFFSMKGMKGMKGVKDVQKKMHFRAEARRRGWDDGGGWRQVFSWRGYFRSIFRPSGWRRDTGEWFGAMGGDENSKLFLGFELSLGIYVTCL